MAGFFEWLFGGGKKKEQPVRDSRPVWNNEHNEVLERAFGPRSSFFLSDFLRFLIPKLVVLFAAFVGRGLVTKESVP